MSFRHATLFASLLAAAVCPLVAHAGDAGTGTPRFSVVVGYAAAEPTKNLQSIKVDGEGTPTLGATYNFDQHWAVELWASQPYGMRFKDKANGEFLGNVDAQPLALSAQYHFRDADKILRPFVGLGYHETNYDFQTGLFVAPVGFETVKGAIVTAGLDITMSPRWFARFDARYLEGSADVTVDDIKIERSKFEPVMVSVGLGARF